MRRCARLLFWTALLVPVFAHARCGYVRTSYKKISCKPFAKEKDNFAEVVSSATALPGLEETAVGPLDELTCECEYVLDGSNPLCDSDRAQEFTQTYPQDPSAPVCPRAKSLCASVCPKKLF